MILGKPIWEDVVGHVSAVGTMILTHTAHIMNHHYAIPIKIGAICFPVKTTQAKYDQPLQEQQV